MKNYFSILFLLLTNVFAFSQNTESEMADPMYANGKIYVVVGVVVIIFIGIIAYLIMIDRKVSKIEKELKEKK